MPIGNIWPFSQPAAHFSILTTSIWSTICVDHILCKALWISQILQPCLNNSSVYSWANTRSSPFSGLRPRENIQSGSQPAAHCWTFTTGIWSEICFGYTFRLLLWISQLLQPCLKHTSVYSWTNTRSSLFWGLGPIGNIWSFSQPAAQFSTFTTGVWSTIWCGHTFVCPHKMPSVYSRA